MEEIDVDLVVAGDVVAVGFGVKIVADPFSMGFDVENASEFDVEIPPEFDVKIAPELSV